MSSIYIFGAGGRGREVYDIVLSSSLSLLAFLDDACAGTNVEGKPVNALDGHWNLNAPIIIAVGEPKYRKKIKERLTLIGAELGNVISPLSSVSSTAFVGKGVTISPYASIQSKAIIGDNVDVNTASIIGHDVIVGESSVISSQVNLGGSVVVGSGCYIGMGALVKEGVKLGAGSIIGMGSVVHKDIPDNMVALGSPARVIRKNETGMVFGGTA